MKTHFFFLLLTFLGYQLKAQNNDIENIDRILQPIFDGDNQELFNSKIDSLRFIHCKQKNAACLTISLWENKSLSMNGSTEIALKNTLKHVEIIPKDANFSSLRAQFYNLLSSIYLESRDTENAKIYIDKAKVHLTNKSDNQDIVAETLHTEGILAYLLKDYETAVEHLKQCIKIQETIAPNSSQLAVSYNDISIIYRVLRRPDLFAFYLEKAQPIYEKTYAAEHPQMLTFYQNLGAAYMDNGENETAVSYFKKVIYHYKENQIPPDRNYINSSIFLGFQLKVIGKPKEEYQVWNTLFNDIEENPTLPIALKASVITFYMKAMTRIKKFDVDLANKLLQKANSYLPDLDKKQKITLAVAEIYAKLDKYETARKLAESVKNFPNQENVEYGEASLVLAKIAFLQKDYKKALVSSHEVLWKGTPGFADTSIYANPSIEVLDKHSVAYMRLIEKSEYAFTYYQQVSQRPEDLQICLDIADIIDKKLQQLNGFQNFGSGKSHWRYLLERLPRLINTVVEGHLLTGDNARMEQAFRMSENAKVFDLKRTLSEKKLGDLGLVSKELLSKRKDIQYEITKIEKNIFEKDTTTQWQEEELFHLQSQLAKLEKEIREKHPNYHALSASINDESLSKINQSLPENTYLIDYQLTDNQLIAFLINNKSTSIKRQNLSEDLKKLITKMIKDTKNTSVSAKDFQKTSYAVFKGILQPIVDNIPVGSHLIFTPHGILNPLPFETLCTEINESNSYQDLPYLIKKYELSYLVATSSRLRTSPDKNDLISIAGFAPIYNEESKSEEKWVRDLVRDGNFRLPFAEKEVKNITKLLGGNAFIGEEASLENFLQEAAKYKILHLAMHAHLEEDNPYFSKFLFSGSNGENKTLTVGELYQLYLQTELCVLSACNTGQGDEKTGKGVISLSNAFTYAGVASTLYSLWQVPDKQTSEVMLNFYDGIKKGENKAISLKTAKLDYLQNVKSEAAAHPYFWAGFVLSGNTDSISFKKSNSIIFWLPFLLLLFLINPIRRKLVNILRRS